jgi:hypothetical protein
VLWNAFGDKRTPSRLTCLLSPNRNLFYQIRDESFEGRGGRIANYEFDLLVLCPSASIFAFKINSNQ